MRKSTLVLLLIALFLGSCKSKKKEIIIVPDVEKTHLELVRLFGKVKSVKTSTYMVEEISVGDSIVPEEVLISTKIQNYSPDACLLNVLTLNDAHDTVLIRQIHYHNDAKQDYWEETDSAGNILNRGVYEYDISRYLVAEKIYAGDSLIRERRYKNDGRGNAIEMIQIFHSYQLKNLVYYNELGLVERIEEFEPNGKLFKYIIIEYDNYGDEVNRKAFKSGDQLIEYTYTQYEQDGRLIKVTFDNRRHNLKEIREYTHHDTYHNWVEEKLSIGNHIAQIRKREILYY